MIGSAPRLPRILRAGATIFLALLVALLSAARPTGAAGTPPVGASPAGGQVFEDVPNTNPLYNFINQLYWDGVISGYTCGGTNPPEPCGPENRPYYRPNSPVTRAQMAKFVDNGRHMAGISIDSPTHAQPIFANTGAASGVAIKGVHGAFTGAGAGVEGATASFDTNATGVLGVVVPANPGVSSAGVRGVNNSTGSAGAGVYGSHAGTGYGVQGTSVSGTGGYFRSAYIGLQAYTTGVTSVDKAVHGLAGGDATGLVGLNTNVGGAGGIGVSAVHQGGGTGLYATSASGRGVWAGSSGAGIYGAAIYAANDAAGHYAGYFSGEVVVTGACCSAAMGTYRIDHPQDPAHQYLTQAAVTSPDLLDVINGNVTLDAKGMATVALPAWFMATTNQYRYQLTAVSAPGPGLYISQKAANNTFSIAGGAAGGEVSWQVTGVRSDPYAAANRPVVETPKPADAQGTYLQPELYGQPATARYGAGPAPGK